MLIGRRPSSGRRVLSRKPPPVAAPARHLAAVDLDPLADADEAVAEAVARRGAVAVVAHLDLQLVAARSGRSTSARAGVRVLERVGQALLDDPVGGEVERAREREAARRRPAAAPAGPARPTSSSSASRPSRPGCGRELDVVAVAAHRAEQAAHLGERRAAGLLDAARAPRVSSRERVGQLVPDGADLQHHHADGVGDDVVQLARDPRALLGDRDRAPPPRARARRCGARSSAASACCGALAQGEAGEPADREQHRDEDELAGGVVGVVVDDDRRAAEHDRQAEPCLRVVAEVAEQERGGHAGDERRWP